MRICGVPGSARIPVVLTALWLLIMSAAAADPLPMPAHWMGGRLVPAKAVPVDMTAEKLAVRLSQTKPPAKLRDESELSPARADVEVTYTLRADAAITVPIVFPVINEPRSVQFELNGKAVATRTTPDLKLYPAYESAWRASVGRFVSADRTLAGLRDEAARSRAESAGSDAGRRRERSGTDAFMRINSRARRQLAQLGRADAEHLAWGLSHYLLDDWNRLGADLPGSSPDFEARRKFTAERELALAFDPKTPDPLALWSPAAPGEPDPLSMFTQVALISARLNLRQGDNQFRVRYQHRVSFVNVRYELPAKPVGYAPSHKQAGVFEFILRTARFWRSFGNLEVSVALPPGTVYATCSLPGATISLTGDSPRVTCGSRDLPDKNLAVTFADFKAIPDPEADPLGRDSKPAAGGALRALWDCPLGSGGHFGSIPVVDDTTVAVGGEESVTLCDRSTGKIIRQMKVEGEAAGLLLLPDRVYAGVDLGRSNPTHPTVGVVCLDRKTGQQRWVQSVRAEIGRGFSPVVLQATKTLVVWAQGGPAFAADPGTGKLLWQQTGDFGGMTLSPDGKTTYLVGVREARGKAAPSGDRKFASLAEVLALDTLSGKVKWHCDAGYSGASPGLWNGRLVIAGCDGRYKDPYLMCLDEGTGRVIWKKPRGKGHSPFNSVHATRVEGDRLLVFHDGGAEACDLRNPPAVLWQARFKYQLYRRPAITGRVAYAPSRLGGLEQLDLTTGELLGNLDCTGADCVATAAGDRIYTVEHSGLLTAWSLQAEKAPAATAPAGEGWPGVPPSDLAEVLAGGAASPAQPGPSPAAQQADSAASGRPLRSAIPAVVLALVALGAAAAWARRRRVSSG